MKASQLDIERIAQLIQDLFRITDELSAMTQRRFTPDGHLVGSIGEVLASTEFGLDLLPHSMKGRDAKKGDLWVEIKATFGERVAFRGHETDANGRCLVLKLSKTKPHIERVVYNGPIKPIVDALAVRSLPSNGQIQISLTHLAKLDALVADEDRLPRLERGSFQ